MGRCWLWGGFGGGGGGLVKFSGGRSGIGSGSGGGGGGGRRDGMNGCLSFFLCFALDGCLLFLPLLLFCTALHRSAPLLSTCAAVCAANSAPATKTWQLDRQNEGWRGSLT